MTERLGWKCPECGNVYAPHVEKCESCSAEHKSSCPVWNYWRYWPLDTESIRTIKPKIEIWQECK